jgi:hypothetical protein
MTRFLIVGLISVLASPAVADTLVDAMFRPGTDCYARTYDTAHLVAHPDQQVTEMAIGPWGARFDGDRFLLLVNVRVRGESDVLSGLGYCTYGDTLDCDMEGDAGTFWVERQGDSLMLRPVGRGMNFETATDFVTLAADTGDDRAFRLDPVGPGLCPMP